MAAVFSPTAASISAAVFPTSTSFAPANRKHGSAAYRCARWMSISFFIPVVSGRRPIFSTSLPVMTTAELSVIAAAQPDVG